jgi:hypothetical protein
MLGESHYWLDSARPENPGTASFLSRRLLYEMPLIVRRVTVSSLMYGETWGIERAPK